MRWRSLPIWTVLSAVFLAGLPPTAPVAGRDNAFAIRVEDVSCGHATLPTVPSMRAQGQFCVVALRFRNVSGGSVWWFTLTAALQETIYEDGSRVRASTRATEALTGRHNPYAMRVNAGIEVGGRVVFDIAPGARIVRLRVKESFLSRGVVISARPSLPMSATHE